MRYFDDWIEGCVEHTKEWASAEDFRRWAAVSAIAGVMGRRCWYDRGDFKCRANQFIVLVGGPATGKSLAMDFYYGSGGPFYNLSISPRIKGETPYDANWTDYLENRSKPLVLASGSFTSRELVDICAENSQCSMHVPGVSFRDNTITIYTTEFGTLVDPNDFKLYTMFTEGWDASKPYSHRTATSGKANVPGFCLNWAACATPSQFIERMPASISNQGLLSRILPIYVPSRIGSDKIRVDVQRNKERLERLTLDLADIAKLSGEFKFSEDAALNAQAWLDNKCLPVLNDPMLQEYNGRRFSHLIKLSMALSASRRSTMIIELEDWLRAQSMLFDAERRMPLLLRRFGMSDSGRFFDDLLEFVRRNDGEVTMKELRKESQRLSKYVKDVEQGIQVLVDSGQLTKRGGGTKAVYKLGDI